MLCDRYLASGLAVQRADDLGPAFLAGINAHAELHRLATTIETWWPQINALLTTGITNAGSEGTNRVIKTVARDAYGFRNPEISGYGPHRDHPTPPRTPQPRLTSKSPQSAPALAGTPQIRILDLCEEK